MISYPQLRRRVVTPLVVLFLVFSINGCSLLAREPAETLAVTERQAQLMKLDRWIAKGRIALVSGDQGFNVAMRWQQHIEDYAVTLTGPLGARLLRGQQVNNLAELQVRGREPVTGRSLEALIQRSLNAPVPMEQLAFWLRGILGDATNPSWDEYGRLLSMEYEDASGTRWMAKITGYSDIQGMELPSLIEIIGGRNEIKVSVKDWDLSPEGDLGPDTLKPATPSNRIPIPGVT